MELNKNYRPFDLEKAKAGERIVTRDGHPARIISWDREHMTDHIVALVEYTEDGETTEEVMTYTDQGRYYDDGNESCNDLFMAPTIVEKWVNVYKCGCGYCYIYHDSEQEALEKKDYYSEYVATTKISWEE